MAVRRVRGDRAFKRLIKRLPVAARLEIAAQLEITGDQVLSAQQARAPVYHGKLRKGVVPGALRGGLSKRILRGRLQLKVGLVGKPTNQRLFYGRVVDHGRKGQQVRVRRANSKEYIMRVAGMAPRPFIHVIPMQQIASPFRQIWVRALAKSSGADSDN